MTEAVAAAFYVFWSFLKITISRGRASMLMYASRKTDFKLWGPFRARKSIDWGASCKCLNYGRFTHKRLEKSLIEGGAEIRWDVCILARRAHSAKRLIARSALLREAHYCAKRPICLTFLLDALALLCATSLY